MGNEGNEGNEGTEGTEDLAARVARLEQQLAAAGAALGAGAAPSTAVRKRAARRHEIEITKPIGKGLRTVVQIAVAAIPGAGVVAGSKSLLAGVIVALALTPAVTVAQNALEKAEKIPALFRRWVDEDDELPSHATGPDLAP